MRIVALVLVSIAVSGGGIAVAQSDTAARERAAGSSAQEAPEEVVVRGQRLTVLRFEVQSARERAYDAFNAINSDDDFDVHCRDESQVFTRVKRRVCRAQFENRISADAAAEYLSALSWVCPADGNGTQACMFSGAATHAISRAQSVEAEAPGKRHLLNEEMLRLAREDERFAQAIIDWYDANQRYEEARKRRKD